MPNKQKKNLSVKERTFTHFIMRRSHLKGLHIVSKSSSQPFSQHPFKGILSLHHLQSNPSLCHTLMSKAPLPEGSYFSTQSLQTDIRLSANQHIHHPGSVMCFSSFHYIVLTQFHYNIRSLYNFTSSCLSTFIFSATLPVITTSSCFYPVF